MLKKTEDITVPESKGLSTVPNYFSLQKNQSPNMMDVKVNYDGSIEERLGSNTQNAVIIANSAAAGFTQNSTGTLAENLRSFWQLNEASGERADIVGGVTLLDSGNVLSTGGIKNNAALFVAVTGQSLYAQNPPTLTGNTSFTISTWFYLNSTSPTAQRTLVSKSDYIPGVSADADTIVLSHYNSNFSDVSRIRTTVTTAGGVMLSPAQSKFGGVSAYFPSPGTISYANNTVYGIGTGDFTVDLNVRPDSLSNESVFDIGNFSSASGIDVRWDGTTIYLQNNNAGVISGPHGMVTTGGFYHLALVRSSGTAIIFVQGNSVAAGSFTTDLSTSNGTVIFGRNATATRNFLGYMDEVRVSKKARWISSFTPPTSAYGDSASEFEYWLYVDTNNRVTFDVSSSGLVANGSIVANSIGALNTSTWYNAVAYMDNSSGFIGVSVNLQLNSAAYTSGIKSSSAPFVLGAISNGSAAFMDGRIDETGYWTKLISKGEREDLYNSGNSSTYTLPFDGQPWAAFDFGASSIRWLTVAAGTGLYASSNLGVTFVNIATDRSATYQRFERSKNVLVATSDAYDNPLYWSGSAGTFAVLLNPSAPLCKISVNFQGFLILLNSNTRKRGFYYIDENTQLTGGTFNNFDIPSSADDEITDAFVLRRYLYVSTRYKLFRVSYVGGNPDWQYIEVKNWGFIPRTAKKIILTNNQPGVGFYYSIGEVAVGLTFDQKIRIFDGSGDQIISNPIEKDNQYCDFALEKIPYVGSGPVISFAETDPNQNIYKLCLAMGQDSTQTTHFLNYDGRALAFYPYSRMNFNCMCMAESANRRFLMAFDRSGKCHMMDSGHLDGNTVSINGIFDSPLLYEKSPSQSHKGYRTDLFFSNTSAGNVIYSDRLDGSVDFKARKEFIISGSSRRLFHYESIDVPETYNVYQFRISHTDGDINPWRLLRWDHFVAGLGIGVNSYER